MLLEGIVARGSDIPTLARELFETSGAAEDASRARSRDLWVATVTTSFGLLDVTRVLSAAAFELTCPGGAYGAAIWARTGSGAVCGFHD